jgi:Glycosyl transferase family 2
MIYVCVTAHNNARTVGLLLWKIRQVLGQTNRECQLLVADDGSTDETPDVLQRYQRALPLTVLTRTRPGAGGCYAALLEEAVRRSDRLRRDAAVLIPGDFSVSPDGLTDLLRRLESGADLAVGEAPLPRQRSRRLVRRLTPWLLRPGIRVPGVTDFLSGCLAVRLVAARAVLRERPEALLDTDGTAGRAELLARLAGAARQMTAVPLNAGAAEGVRAEGALALALTLRRLGRSTHVEPPQPLAPRPEAAETPANSRVS